MDIPAKVSVFNKTLEVKGKPGLLVAIGQDYYEIQLEVQNNRTHTVLFPVTETVVIFNEPVPSPPVDFDVER